MVEQIKQQGSFNLWDASFDTMEVEFTENGKMVISTNTGLFDNDGNKVAETRPSKSGKTQVVATTGGNVPVKTLKNGKTLVLGLTAYIK